MAHAHIVHAESKMNEALKWEQTPPEMRTSCSISVIHSISLVSLYMYSARILIVEFNIHVHVYSHTYSFQQSLQKWCSQGTCTSTADGTQHIPHSHSDWGSTELTCPPAPQPPGPSSRRLWTPRLEGSWTPAFSHTSSGLLIHASNRSSLDQPEVKTS